MNIAILSGKGGTGKTTISVNLTLALEANYIDADVEEPNGFIFLNPEVYEEKNVMEDSPVIDKDKCTLCGQCVKACQFNALAKTKDNVIVFHKLCHSCSACKIVCKHEAISYSKREIGKIEKGKAKNINCSRGILNVGEPMAVPIIRELLKNLKDGLNIIDCPPGTSCNVVNVLKYTDRAVLVTEPSEFGFHDLKMAIEVVRMYNIPFGIIINKDDNEDNVIKKYCESEKIKLIGTIPYNKKTASLYSKGNILYEDLDHKYLFDNLARNLKEVLLWN